MAPSVYHGMQTSALAPAKVRTLLKGIPDLLDQFERYMTRRGKSLDAVVYIAQKDLAGWCLNGCRSLQERTTEERRQHIARCMEHLRRVGTIRGVFHATSVHEERWLEEATSDQNLDRPTRAMLHYLLSELYKRRMEDSISACGGGTASKLYSELEALEARHRTLFLTHGGGTLPTWQCCVCGGRNSHALQCQTERCGQIRPARSTALPSAPHPSAYAMPVQALDFERTVASAGAGDTAAGLHDVATSLMALSVPPSPPSPSPPPPPRGSTCSALYNTAGARASISMSHAHEPP